jgi:hypothetical protein
MWGHYCALVLDNLMAAQNVKNIILFYYLCMTMVNALLWCLLTLDMVSSQLQLHRYHTGRESRVVTALTLLKKHLFKLSFICF